MYQIVFGLLRRLGIGMGLIEIKKQKGYDSYKKNICFICD